jgi:hypothetical protein
MGNTSGDLDERRVVLVAGVFAWGMREKIARVI